MGGCAPAAGRRILVRMAAYFAISAQRWATRRCRDRALPVSRFVQTDLRDTGRAPLYARGSSLGRVRRSIYSWPAPDGGRLSHRLRQAARYARIREAIEFLPVHAHGGFPRSGSTARSRVVFREWESRSAVCFPCHPARLSVGSAKAATARFQAGRSAEHVRAHGKTGSDRRASVHAVRAGGPCPQQFHTARHGTGGGQQKSSFRVVVDGEQKN